MALSKTSGIKKKDEELQQIGLIEDLDGLWESLGFNLAPRLPSSSSSSSFSAISSDKKDLGNSDEEAGGSSDEAERQRKIWTSHVLVDMSCDGKVLVLASQKQITVLTGKWKSERQLVFTKFWNGSLAEESGSAEILTCCLTLPLASRHRSSDGIADWTCIVYGFRSGFVAFHTETGYTVHRQQFDLASVVQIKFSSHHRLGLNDVSAQELIILYDNGIVVVINASELYHSLQSFKTNTADAISRKRSEDEDVETRSISHEKYQLDTHQTIHDIISLGSSQIHGFDQLWNASILGGRDAVVKMPLPNFHRLIAVGGYPLFSSYFISEGESGLEIGQVAKAVASKVTAAVTSKITNAAFRFGIQGLLNRAMPATKPVQEKKQKVLPKAAKDVEARFSIFDDRRCASHIVSSASGRLAAMTDYFGRVLLLDCTSGLIVRMWKGYRSAEVAWITLNGTSGSDKKLTFVECLIVYAPRRHLLEVWNPLSGRRLVALHVSQGLRLLPLRPHPLHFQSVCDQQSFLTSTCYFLDICGKIYSLYVPFYLIEEGINLEDARDAQTFQKLKEAIFGPADKIPKLIEELSSLEIKDQAVELIVRNAECGIGNTELCEILEKEIEVYSLEEVGEKYRTRLIIRKWKVLLASLRLYQKIHGAWMAPKSDLKCSSEESFPQKLKDISQSAVLPLLESVAAARKKYTLKEKPVDWRLFIEQFRANHGGSNEDEVVFSVEEKDHLENFDLAWSVLGPYFQGRITLEYFLGIIIVLDKENIYTFLVNLWLSTSFDLSGDPLEKLRLLQSLLSSLFPIGPPQSLELTHLLLEKSQNLPAALILSFVIICTFLPRSKFNTNLEPESEEWESICKEFVEWTRLSQRLESLLSLQGFLVRFMPPNKKLEESDQLSVRQFICRGRCASAEYLACWSANGFLDLPPTAVMKAFYSSDIEIQLPSLESEEKDDRPLRFLNISQLSFDRKEITEALIVLKAIFPKGLHPDILLAECAWALMVLFNKQPQEVGLMNSAASYLSDIINGTISHGLSLLIWKTFLSERMSLCCNLIEKVGKVPKERLFTRDLNMTESAVMAFLILTHKLLGFLLDADATSPSLILEPDFLWIEAEMSGRTSVVELAIQQPITTAPLIRHHLILLDILRAIMQFNLKSVKPLSLFDFKGREAFFKDLTSHPLLSVMEVDQSLSRNRTQFLTRAFGAVVRSAWEHCTKPDVEWIENLMKIAFYWEINGDESRSIYVMELYSHGMDDIAQEAFNVVTDKQPLLSRLFILVGQRLALLTININSQTDYARNLSSMSPKMVSWIRGMDASGLANQNVEWQPTYLLIRNISHAFNRYNPDYKLCLEVFEWMQSIIAEK